MYITYLIVRERSAKLYSCISRVGVLYESCVDTSLLIEIPINMLLSLFNMVSTRRIELFLLHLSLEASSCVFQSYLVTLSTYELVAMCQGFL